MTKLLIGTPVRTKPTRDWLKGRYAGQKAFIKERTPGPVEYSLLFETQGIAWYTAREFEVLPLEPGDAELYLKWLNEGFWK